MKDNACPCGSGKLYEECCARYILGIENAPSPEALMRSRFTAFSRGDLVYIEKTVCGPAKAQFDPKEAECMMRETEWKALEVVASHECGDEGTVEFYATFTLQGQTRVMHEMSSFKKVGGTWLYYSGNVDFKH